MVGSTTPRAPGGATAAPDRHPPEGPPRARGSRALFPSGGRRPASTGHPPAGRAAAEPTISVLAAYRRTGADLPFGDPLARPRRRARGLLLADDRPGGRPRRDRRSAASPRGRTARGRLVDARRPPGRRAAHRAGARRGRRPRTAWACAPARRSRGDAERLRVDLGAGARLDVALHERRALAAAGVRRARPRAGGPGARRSTGIRTCSARGWRGHGDARAAGPSAWTARPPTPRRTGARRSPEHWWWGQAHGVRRPGAVRRLRRRARCGCAGVAAAPTAVVVVAPATSCSRSRRRSRARSRPPGPSGWRVRARSARHRVELEGDAGTAGTLALPVPLPGGARGTELRSRQGLAGRLRRRGAARPPAALPRRVARSPGSSTACSGLSRTQRRSARRRRSRAARRRPAARTGRSPPTARAGASRPRRRPAARAPR